MLILLQASRYDHVPKAGWASCKLQSAQTPAFISFHSATQSSGWSALRVSPLLRDSEEGPQPIEQTAAFLPHGQTTRIEKLL